MTDRDAYLLLPWLALALALACAAQGCEALAEQGRDRCDDLSRAVEDRDGLPASYQATYTRLDGNCGELEIPGSFMLDGVHKQTTVDFEIETQVILNGCSMFLAQTVRKRTTGQVQLEVDGDALQARDTDTISGEVRADRFDARGVTTCTGSYDAQLERQTVVAQAARE